MIRKLTGADIDETAIIWLETNIKAHDFISFDEEKSFDKKSNTPSRQKSWRDQGQKGHA